MNANIQKQIENYIYINSKENAKSLMRLNAAKFHLDELIVISGWVDQKTDQHSCDHR